jgi:hypothetical protein
MPKMNARVRALDEKLRNLNERAKAARGAALGMAMSISSCTGTG